MSKKKIPFWMLPASWGLNGKTRAIAEAEYYFEGKELEEKLAEIGGNTPEDKEVAVLAVKLKHEEISQDAYLAARRIVRRWSRNQAVYGDSSSRFPTAVVPRVGTRQVARASQDTGLVTRRRVRRRRNFCELGGLAGGYALVNDGPGFGVQLAYALRQCRAG
jgi:hypothetical protein